MRSVKSTFIKTPSRKMFRAIADYTKGDPLPTEGAYLFTSAIITRECAGGIVRCDFTVFQDEAEAIPKEEIKKLYLDAGALSVDIRITRLPRENVRADAVLKAETLRDKLVAAAELRGETVSESILQKADALEGMDSEKLINSLTMPLQGFTV